jgi:hypothetical protein
MIYYNVIEYNTMYRSNCGSRIDVHARRPRGVVLTHQMASSSDAVEPSSSTPPANSVAADKAYAVFSGLDVRLGGIPNVNKQKRLLVKHSTFSDNDVFESSKRRTRTAKNDLLDEFTRLTSSPHQGILPAKLPDEFTSAKKDILPDEFTAPAKLPDKFTRDKKDIMPAKLPDEFTSAKKDIMPDEFTTPTKLPDKFTHAKKDILPAKLPDEFTSAKKGIPPAKLPDEFTSAKNDIMPRKGIPP